MSETVRVDFEVIADRYVMACRRGDLWNQRRLLDLMEVCLKYRIRDKCRRKQ